MTPEERSAILDALVRLLRQDSELVRSLTTFLPLAAHRHALSRDAVVVLGGRGAGKTALFRLVNDARTAPRLRLFFEDDRIPDATWFDAFSQEAMKHPEVGTMEAWATSASDLSLRTFWMTHLLRRVHEEVPGIERIPPAVEAVLKTPAADLAAWLPVAEAHLGAVSAALDATERALVAADRSVFATYDNLDRVGQHEPGIRRRYMSTLLALWLSLANRYKQLRGKIFLRDDRFDAGELGFADAGKLRARAETITWDPEALYRVVVRHLAGTSETMRAWLRDVPGLALRDRGEFGWMPGEMPAGVQRDFITRLAWRVIGKGVLKGETHRWIVNRLQDANKRVTPRAILWFFGFAGEEAKKRPPGRRKTPLIADDLVEALQRTSHERVAEIHEEYPAAVRMENLRGMKIPLRRDEVVQRISVPRHDEQEGIPTSGAAILSELLRLGVLQARDDGQLDVPDIYRYAYAITPDYATAWADFLKEDSPTAREMLIRELPILPQILQTHAAGKWAAVARDEIARGDYAAARAQCQRMLDLARSGENVGGESDVLAQLGQVELLEKDPRSAAETFRRALELARRCRDEPRQARLLLLFGMASSQTGDAEVASRAGEEAVRLSRKLKDGGSEVLALILLSFAARKSAPDKAAEHAVRSLSVSQNIGVQYLEAFAFSQLSGVAGDAGNLTSAIQLMALSELLAIRGKLTLLATALETLPSLDPEEVEALRTQAAEAYAHDRGWGVVREAFPDLAPPAA
jgi:tetratricopeptide (TPR) repeat protein